MMLDVVDLAEVVWDVEGPSANQTSEKGGGVDGC